MNEYKTLEELRAEPRFKVEIVHTDGEVSSHNFPESIKDMKLKSYKGAKIVHREDASILIDNSIEARREVKGPVDEY